MGNSIKLCAYCGNIITSPKYCNNNKCQHLKEYEDYIDRWKKGLEKGGGLYRVSYQVKTYLRNKFNNQCVKCGWNVVNTHTGSIPLEVSHIDGDWRNNTEDNLELLCPNCHALTASYRGRNKGHGRHSVLKNRGKVTFGK